MDKFKFHGELYEVANELEEPHRVITGINRDIKNLLDETEILGQTSLSTIGNESNSQQIINLTLNKSKLIGPEGPRGEVGPAPGVGQVTASSYIYDKTSPTISISQQDNSKLDFDFNLPVPNIFIGSVTEGNPEVWIQNIDEDGHYDPLYTRLNFVLPKGETGHTPIIIIDPSEDGVKTLAPENDAYVRMVTPDTGSDGDVVLQFGIPRGHRGEKGDTGKPFIVAKKYASYQAMVADYNNIEEQDYIVIGTDVETEENARLYHKPSAKDFGTWTSDERNYIEKNDNDVIIKELDFVGDFSGARGAHAAALAGTATKLTSTAAPTVTLRTAPTYNSNTDSYESIFDFGIPAGAASKITSVTASTVFNSVATVTSNTNYNENTGTYDTTLSFEIPKGDKGDKGEAPTIAIGTVTTTSTTPTASITTGTNTDYVLNLGLPRGEQGMDGQLVDINTINPSNKYVGNIAINANNPGILDVTKTTITNDDLPATISASKITLTAGNIPDLPTSKITSGTFDTARIPDLSATKITSDTLDTARIPNLSATKITSDTLDADRLPSIPTTKITGTLPVNKGGTGKTAWSYDELVYGAGNELNQIQNAEGVLYWEETGTAPGNIPKFGTAPVAFGGTGATTSAAARTNLDVYSKSEVDTAINNGKTTVAVTNGIISFT